MPEIKPGNLDWLDDLAALTAQTEKTPSAKRKELAKALNLHPTMVTFLKAIKPCFDQAAIEKVRQAAKADPPYTLSFNSARALAGLKKKKVSDLTGKVHAALDVILTHRLATKHIKALVGWIAGGKPASEFDPKAKPTETTEEITEPEAEEKNTKRNNTKKVKTETLGQWIGSGIDRIVGFFSGVSPTANAIGDPISQKLHGEGMSTSKGFKRTKKKSKLVVHWFKKIGEKLAKVPWKQFGKFEHQACKKLARVIVPLHNSSHTGSSRRSGRAHSTGGFRQGLITLVLTPLHGLVYILLQYGFWFTVAAVFICPFFPALKPLLEWPFRFTAHLALYDLPAWVWACAHNYLWPTLVIGLLLAVGLVFAWKAEPLRISLISAALAYLIIHGRGWSAQSTSWSEPVVNEKPAVSATPAVAKLVRRSKLKTSNSSLQTSNSTRVVAYQPAVSFIPASSGKTLYDPKILELEIAAIPKNSIIKDYVLQPDEGMPADLAVSRLQDLTDSDKYTMMIGGAKQKIESFTPSSTNFIITYQSTDLFGLFGNHSGSMNFFWEDVLYIHTDELDKEQVRSSELGSSRTKTPNPSLLTSNSGNAIYQCSVVVKDGKYPLTIQCASADDLENLVSTLEYFIRHSRLGHDAQPGGMPYPAQGLRLKGQNQVETLWAGSPADKAGLKLGNMIWSLDQNTPDQQDRKALETGLQTLTPGPHTLYMVNPADFAQAQRDVSFGRARSFNPKRYAVPINGI